MPHLYYDHRRHQYVVIRSYTSITIIFMYEKHHSIMMVTVDAYNCFIKKVLTCLSLDTVFIHHLTFML